MRFVIAIDKPKPSDDLSLKIRIQYVDPELARIGEDLEVLAKFVGT